jgi:hypothetical protein
MQTGPGERPGNDEEADMTEVLTNEVLDSETVAEMLGWKPKTVSVQLSRARSRRDAGIFRVADIPDPDAVLPGRNAWHRSTIEQYIEVRKSSLWRRGRPRKNAE